LNRSTGDLTKVASMTGYGRATGETVFGRITVEVRSLNHRHLDVVLRAPRSLIHLDPDVRNRVRGSVSRGKVEVFLTFEERQPDYAIDTDRALMVAKALENVAGVIGDTVRLEHVLAAVDIVQTSEVNADGEVSSVILETVEQALGKMVEYRFEEGKALARDLLSRSGDLTALTESIEKLAPEVTNRAKQNMIQFLDDHDQTERMDSQRLEMEIAMLAQRSDITEEIIRLKTHHNSFQEALTKGGVIGRRLDFLIQEMQREINTIGSKSGIPEISERVVDFKTGLEKVREQVQNIE
jgi:uncharacterized protein (TIGR00255 family)